VCLTCGRISLFTTTTAAAFSGSVGLVRRKLG
jgi:hypothetical protein